MNLLDAKTILFSYGVSNAISATVILLLWLQNRRRFAGLGFWLADFVMQFVALALVVARGTVPDFVSMTISNALIIGGTILLFMGLERFVRKRSTPTFNTVLLAVFIPAHAYFVLIYPDLNARTIILSAGILVLCFQCAWLMLRRVDAETRSITRGVGTVFAAYCVVSVGRIIVNFVFPSDSNLFNPNLPDVLLLMLDQMLFIVLTFNLFLMVNRRLVVDLEKDIAERKRAEATIASLAKFPNENPNPILRVDGNGMVLYANSSASLLLQSLESAVDRPAPASWQVWVTQTLDKQAGQTVEMEYDGRVYTCELAPIRESGYVNLYFRDITEHKQAEQHLRESREDFERYFNMGTVGMCVTSPEKGWIEVNDRLCQMLAYSRDELHKFTWSELTHPDDLDLDLELFEQTLAGKRDAYQLDKRFIRKDGSTVYTSLYVTCHRNPDDSVRYVLASLVDITERKRAEEEIQLLQAELREQAIRDPLTGLYNRRYLDEIVEREVARAARENYPISFVMMDIDHFKDTNDTYGHNAGDTVLQRIAAQFIGQTRIGDVICRYGGEEFLAVLPNVSTEIAYQVAERWRKSIQDAKLFLENREIRNTISCGIAAYPKDGDTNAVIISMADKALYQAKHDGRNRVIIWKNGSK